MNHTDRNRARWREMWIREKESDKNLDTDTETEIEIERVLKM